MPTIEQTRMLKKHQYLLDPYIPKARELEHIREAAKARWRATDSTDKHSHFWGAMGELVVADVLGTQVDETAHPDNSDHGVDGEYNSQTYDVKLSTFHTDPILKVPLTTKEFADLYILVAVNTSALVAEIVGWATREEVTAAATGNFGHGTNFILKRRELHPIEELWGE